MRAVSLLSGGLDSLLATRVILEQGIEVEAVNFVSVFCTCTPKRSGCSAARTAVQQLGVPLHALNTTEEFLRIVQSPRHGYGRNMNPCLDCRILMFRKAKELMKKVGAQFLVTGEVLGERPMSQRHEAMKLIEREAAVEGLVVRPLSATLLEPSIPEQEGWIDRSRLLALRGRCRKPQLELAQSYALKDYPCPAGGCLLTDAGFAARMRDLLAHSGELRLHDVRLLKLGRHFRLAPTAKAVVGRDEHENQRLIALSCEEDILMEVSDVPGPLTVVRGEAGERELSVSASLTARYSKARGSKRVRVKFRRHTEEAAREVEVEPADEQTVAAFRVGAN